MNVIFETKKKAVTFKSPKGNTCSDAISFLPMVAYERDDSRPNRTEVDIVLGFIKWFVVFTIVIEPNQAD